MSDETSIGDLVRHIKALESRVDSLERRHRWDRVIQPRYITIEAGTGHRVMSNGEVIVFKKRRDRINHAHRLLIAASAGL